MAARDAPFPKWEFFMQALQKLLVGNAPNGLTQKAKVSNTVSAETTLFPQLQKNVRQYVKELVCSI